MTDYDVIIVGGRAAGSTLAAFLGQANIRTLLLERAEFPVPPAASSPIIYAVTMAILDEIGADESKYAANTPKIRRQVADNNGEAFAVIDLPEVKGRDYGYAIDRARFDEELWNTAVGYPAVDGRQGFSVTNLLWEDDTVIGIEGRAKGNTTTEHFTAKAVVGADGRFSLVARKVDAPEVDKHEEHPTSILYAYWKNVQPYDEGNATAVAYGHEDMTMGYLIMDSADNTAAVCVEGRSDAVSTEAGNAEEGYIELLKQNPHVWRRLQGAEIDTKVHGMRKIGNMYRPAGGKGWALVGDAYHQKDPIDGQGIFDSVYTSRTLGKALIAWHEGRTTWDDAITWYDETARAKTDPQFEMTLLRIQQNLYTEDPNPFPVPLPPQALETMARWMFKDKVLQERAGLALNRQIDPRWAKDQKEVLMAMVRGGLRELSERLDPDTQRA